ncbi:MAG: hypothetical protein PVJ67_04240 [Candidatus Pacearchaeota archaeon]|jgi:hypothetical protein
MQLGIKIEVPQKLKRFISSPNKYVTDVMTSADNQALGLLKREISAAAPKKSGALSRSIKVSLANRKIYSILNYARAIELGHYAEPARTPKRMFLKFSEAGKEVFMRFTRSKKQPYFFKTLEQKRRDIIKIYQKAFRKLLESL